MPARDPDLPGIYERIALQKLSSGDWQPMAPLTHRTPISTLMKMIAKGWIERRKREGRVAVKITDTGREAFRAKLPES